MVTIFTICVLLQSMDIYAIKYKELEYEWVQNTDRFDFMVMVVSDSKTISSAVLINYRTAVTAANPLYAISRTWKNRNHPRGLIDIPTFPYKRPGFEYWIRYGSHVYIYTVDGRHDQYRYYFVDTIAFQYDYLKGPRLPFSEKDLYAPNHDLAYLYFRKPLEPWGKRRPFPISLAVTRRTAIRQDGMFTIAGFGYIDKLHVKQMYQLEAIEFKVDEVLVDCDEWILRTWGHFICVLNVEHFIGIDCGAALSYNGILVGIGSFTLTRGNESVLVSTDIRKYKDFRGAYRYGYWSKKDPTYFYDY